MQVGLWHAGSQVRSLRLGPRFSSPIPWCWAPSNRPAPINGLMIKWVSLRSYLEDLSQDGRKWLGWPPPHLQAMKWPFGRGPITPILRGRKRSPWLLTTYKSWDDPPQSGPFKFPLIPYPRKSETGFRVERWERFRRFEFWIWTKYHGKYIEID